MNAVKSHGFAKKLGALVMAMAMTCALAVSASAVDVGDYTSTAYLKADVPIYIPHELKFIESAKVSNTDGKSTVTIEFEDPATVIVTPYGSSTSTERTGTITDVALSSDNTVSVDSFQYKDGTLTIECADTVATSDFCPKLDFTIEIDNEDDDGTTDHTAVSAWLYLK